MLRYYIIVLFQIQFVSNIQRTPLHELTLLGAAKPVALLIQAGADVKAADVHMHACISVR